MRFQSSIAIHFRINSVRYRSGVFLIRNCIPILGSRLISPSWQKFSTTQLQNNKLSNYMPQILVISKLLYSKLRNKVHYRQSNKTKTRWTDVSTVSNNESRSIDCSQFQSIWFFQCFFFLAAKNEDVILQDRRDPAKPVLPANTTMALNSFHLQRWFLFFFIVLF